MRRGLFITGVAALAVLALVITRDGQGDRYRVAAIFDTAKGLVAGQQVKVAGAVVGKVDRVRIVPGPKAEVTMVVDKRFGPFGADATCQILPEGLLSENYVECEPGRADVRQLAETNGLPTVPLAQTAVPTDLQDVINVFSLPTDQRLRVILTELGIATAGRGEDINALLRRSNPALQRTRDVLAIVDRQKDRLSHAIDQTDAVLASLAERKRDLRAFVARAGEVAGATASRRTALAGTVARLPGLLDASRGGLRALDRTMNDATPLLRNLRGAGPRLTRFTEQLPRFAEAARPALRSVAAASTEGRTTARAAQSAVGHLRQASASAVPFSRNLEALLTSTRDTGGLEGTLRFLYSLSSSFSSYDGISHIIGLAVDVLPTCLLDIKSAGCRSRYDSPKGGIIPVNDPDCDVGTGAPWDPPTSCTGTQLLPLPLPVPTDVKGPSKAKGKTSGSDADTDPDAKAGKQSPKPSPAAPTAPARPKEPVAAVKSLLDFLLRP